MDTRTVTGKGFPFKVYLNCPDTGSIMNYLNCYIEENIDSFFDKIYEFEKEKYMEKNNKIIFELINIEDFLLSINDKYINDNLRIESNIKKLRILIDELDYINLNIKTENFIKNKLKDIFKIVYDGCTPFIKLIIVFVYLYKININ